MLENNIIIAGAGHAGLEAAFIVSRMGLSCTLITMDKNAIGRLSCNPAIGGLGKSHLVKEIDALGGIMGYVSDLSTIQNKTLNKTKGRAVWANRSQVDKKQYPKIIKRLLEQNNNINVVEGEVVSFQTKNNKLYSVLLKNQVKLLCKSLIITSGTFLNGLIHIGESTFSAGRMGEKPSNGLSESIAEHGLTLGRLKTGTPPRLNKNSINWDFTNVAPGDTNPKPFSLFTPRPFLINQENCFTVNTNQDVHTVINNNINKSAMFSGKISGVGPRYCPSVEDKVFRFKERDAHVLFLEPEWLNSYQIYLNGFSTSLPENVQIEALKKIDAFKNVSLIRPGYAIEYDFFPPRQLKSTLESKHLSGLFFAGQINGTSGYEEAAAQGLVGGCNAAKFILKEEPLLLSRDSSYIGVMIDDLITSHLDEPYRMFTSRAEHRLFLRPDNVYSRLFSQAKKMNLLSPLQKKQQKTYLDFLSKIESFVSKKTGKNKQPVLSLIKRPEESLSSYIDSEDLTSNDFFDAAVFELETSVKYSGYIENEKERIEKNSKLEYLKIPLNFNYAEVQGLSNESKERLLKIMPETLGQASRIFGIRPTDITVLGVYINSRIVSRET